MFMIYGDQRPFTCDYNSDFVDFCDVNGPDHPTIIKALELMNAYVVAVLDELTALYLHIELVMNTVKVVKPNCLFFNFVTLMLCIVTREFFLIFSFVLKKKDQLDQRGARSVFHHL
ncbi:hypothetical protein Hanom_Chr13g01219241 [Helianthus anomalus]